MSHGTMCGACGTAPMEVVHRASGLPAHSCVLLGDRSEARAFPTGELALAVCPDCGFVANAAHDESLQHYSDNYEETQGFSPRFRDFAQRLAKEVVERHDLGGKHVVEVGCGKGEFLLDVCNASGGGGTGIDPTVKPERVRGEAAGRIEWIRSYLDEQHTSIPSDAIVCRHTLEHIHHPAGFMQLIRKLAESGRDPVVFFEVPDVGRVLDEGAFWDVYYEHCSYFTPGSLARLFRRSGFEPRELEYAFDDQYLLVTARLRRGEPCAPLPIEDDPAGIVDRARRYGATVHGVRAKWRRVLDEARGAGKRIALWGGGSKAVAFLTTVGVGDEVAYVVDINPYKHGTFIAGTAHPVVGPQHLPVAPPDLVIVMNPVYVDEIAEELRRWRVAPELVAV